MVKTTGETAQVHASSAPTRGHNSMAENMAASSFSIHGGVIRAGLGNSDIWIKDDSSAFWANNVGQERRNHESQTTQKPLT